MVGVLSLFGLISIFQEVYFLHDLDGVEGRASLAAIMEMVLDLSAR